MGLQLIKTRPPVSTPPNTNNFGGVVLAALSFVLTLSLSPQAVQGAVAMQQVQANTSGAAAHSKIIDIDFERLPLDKALDIIAQKSGVSVSYRRDQVTGMKPVTLHATRVTAAEAFARVLVGTQYQLQASGAQLYLVERKQTKSAAQGTIVGKITDSKTGKGISGATISLGADTRGAVSDEDGSYKLVSVAAGTHAVSVRLVGYAKQTRSVTVGGSGTVNVDFKLESSASVLDQVVVTGTIIASELRSVPNAITVITAKQIEDRGITRIDQLFRGDIPGLFSVNLGSHASIDNITMFSRGATALSSTSAGTSSGTNPIKTYVDGVEMADPQYLSQIDPRSIERIEILTGPQASTIYGSNAINGVMQVFTKRGNSSAPQLTVNLVAGAIENNSSTKLAPDYRSDARVSGIEGKFSYNIGGSWNYMGAWTPGKQTQRLGMDGGIRSDFGKLTIDVSARRGLTQNRLRATDQQSTSDLRANGIWIYRAGQGAPLLITHSLNGNTWGGTLNYHPMSWWSNEIVLGSDVASTESIRTAPGFSSQTDTGLFVGPTTISRSSQRYASTLQMPVSSWFHLNVTVGGDHWRTRSASSSASPVAIIGTLNNVTNVTRNRPGKNSGAFVQSQIGIADALFLTFGLRTDWNPNFGDKAKVKPGRYGLSYTRDIGPVSAKLRGSYGRAIRPPADGRKTAIAETFSDRVAQFGPFDRTLANPELGPEDQRGGEGGIEIYLGNRGSLIVTRYNQTVDNLISSATTDSVRSLTTTPNILLCSSIFRDPDGYCYRYQQQNLNAGSIRNQGWELTGSLNLGPLTTHGTYSWTKSRILGVTPKYRALLPGFIPGRPFSFIPEHTWALGFTYAHATTTVVLSINGLGPLYKEGLTSDDLSLIANSEIRLTAIRPRIDIPTGYRAVGAGYSTAELNATHKFNSHIDGLLQVTNLTNNYQNDLEATYTAIGRQSRIGIRIKL